MGAVIHNASAGTSPRPAKIQSKHRQWIGCNQVLGHLLQLENSSCLINFNCRGVQRNIAQPSPVSVPDALICVEIYA
jgi:hypothetical protein